MNIKHSSYKLTVVPYQEKDRADFVDIFMDEELCQHMAGGAFEKESEAEILFDHFLTLYTKNVFNSFGVFNQHELVGHFEIAKNSFTKSGEIEIVYLLIKAYWGKGIMVAIIKHFQKLQEQTIVARVKPNNFNSIKMLEKIGIEKQSLTKFNNENVLKISLKKSL